MPSQILLNFSVALSLTLIVFLAATESSYLLSSFLWMAVEAFNMYRAFGPIKIGASEALTAALKA